MKKTVMHSWGDQSPEIRCVKAAEVDEGVIDEATFMTLEVDELFDAVNYATTTFGQAVLYRSLIQPEDSFSAVTDKQGAASEIQENSVLKEKITNTIEQVKEHEGRLLQLLYGRFSGLLGSSNEDNVVDGYGYMPYRTGTRVVLQLVDNINQMPVVDNAYLNHLFDTIKSFSQTRQYSLMKGPVYVREHSVQSKKERAGSFTPAMIFKPTLLKPLFIVLMFILSWLVGQFNPLNASDAAFSLSFDPSFYMMLLPLALLYIPVIGAFDRDHCIYPLRDEFRRSDNVQKMLDALGQLDELLSFIKLKDDYPSVMVMPKVVDKKHYEVSLTQAVNPILGKTVHDYVGNDFSLQKERLAFITGPNSGGKTAFCKTLTQIQLLTQIGCYVPASVATLTVADRIFYQVPVISQLDDGEGRFGTELKRTKGIFLASTAKSLVVLDELSEGTTFEERIETGRNIMGGFLQKRNGTILITHNHQLVDDFFQRGIGLPCQVEFQNEEPSFRLISGISRNSHADRVAKKVGFSKSDIENYLKQDSKQ